jgi:hypothetical protein
MMFADSLVPPFPGKSDVIGTVGAAKHIDMNLHRSPFDKLRVRIIVETGRNDIILEK